MERTELREAIFAETRRDPFAYAIFNLAAQHFALGYEQALRDHGIDDELHLKSYGDRFEDAVEFITSRNREEQVRVLLAMGDLGLLLGGPKVP